MIPYLSVRSPLVSLGLGAISCLVMVGRGIQFLFSDRSDSLIFACGAYGPPGWWLAWDALEHPREVFSSLTTCTYPS